MTDLTIEAIEKLAKGRKGIYRTLRQAAEVTGIEYAELRKAALARELEPDAKLQTGKQGRPAFLYSGKTLQQFARQRRAS